MHTTLKVKTNILLIILWALITGFLFIVIKPYPVIIFYAGLKLGLLCGILQFMSLKKSEEKIKNAATLLEIRKAIKSTGSSIVYIYLLWGSIFLLIFITIKFYPDKFYNIFVGYISMILIRDIITLKPIFDINKK